MNLIAQTTQNSDVTSIPLPPWATVILGIVAGLVAILTAVKLYLIPLVKSMVADVAQIAADAKAQSEHVAAKIYDVQKTASEAKGAAEAANATANDAMYKITPTPEALTSEPTKESNGMNP